MPNIGNISNLIGKKSSAPRSPKPPSRIEVVERRVDTLEATLTTVLSELTALRESVERLKTSTAKPPKENTAKPTETSAKPPATETATETQPPQPKKGSKRKNFAPWDDPETLKALKSCRPRILELLSDGQEITKAGCAEALGIAGALAGRTLSYMMTQTKEIIMIEPPKTPEDPDPKKIFRLKM